METFECVLGITSVPESLDVMPFVEEIVTLKLAACVKVFPVGISVFHWKNKLERKQERIVLIKTTASCVTELSRRLRLFHPDEVPEFVVLPIVGGNPEFLKWVTESTAAFD